jgi:hypothetical protein
LQSGESRRVFRVAVLCLVMLAVGAGSGGGIGVVRAQNSTLDKNQNPTQPKTPNGSADDSDAAGDAMRARMRDDSVRALNDSRHKRLEDDVAKLQALTNELKSDVDKANKDELSLDVMRKAAEIEKLAHDVQSRMRN